MESLPQNPQLLSESSDSSNISAKIDTGVSRRVLLWIIAVLAVGNSIILITSGIVVIRTWEHVHKPKAAIPVIAKSAHVISTSKANDTPPNASYISKSFGIAFNYPGDWEVEEEDDHISINSPFITYEHFDYDDTNNKYLQNARGIIKVYITKEGGFAGGDLVVKDSELIHHPGILKNRKTSYLSYFGKTDSFDSMTFTGGTRLAKGTPLAYDPKVSSYAIPIGLAAGYWDVDAVRQSFGWDQVPLSNFDKPEAFKQAVEIIKSLKAS